MRAQIIIPPEEVEISAIRAQGAGGQNINKVANAAHLRFDINASSLPEAIRERLLKLEDRRISKEGIVIIKAQEFRSLEKNRGEAMRRLQGLVDSVAALPSNAAQLASKRSRWSSRRSISTRAGCPGTSL